MNNQESSFNIVHYWFRQNLNQTLHANRPKPSRKVYANAQKKCKELLSTSHSNSNSNITNDVDLAVNIEKYDATTRQDYDKQRGTFIVTILMH
jgi:hypothetical protein